MKITAKQGQSFWDIAIQECGGIEGCFALALLNEHSVTDLLTIGQQLNPAPITDKRVRKYYRDNEINPATSLTNDQLFRPEGIDYWAVEYDFEVQ